MNRRQFITSCIGVAGAVILGPPLQWIPSELDVSTTIKSIIQQVPDDLVLGVRRQSALILDNYEVTLDEGQQILANHGIDYRPYWEMREHETFLRLNRGPYGGVCFGV